MTEDVLATVSLAVSTGMSGLDLYLSQRTLALMFVYATLTGFCLGLGYDGLRVLRMALGETFLPSRSAGQGRKDNKAGLPLKLLRFVEDLLFMLAAAVALILLCYYTNDGQLRAPAPLGMACGFFVYIHTVSRLVLRLAEGILRLVRRFLLACLHLLAMPLRGLWSLTVGRMAAAHRESVTEKGIKALAESAKRGFDVTGADFSGAIPEEKDGKNQKPPA